MHVALREGDFGRRNDMWINPVLNGHVAIAVPDLGVVKERLSSRGMPFFESGVWAFQGRTQIYCYDPAHNVVEISQAVDRPS